MPEPTNERKQLDECTLLSLSKSQESPPVAWFYVMLKDGCTIDEIRKELPKGEVLEAYVDLDQWAEAYASKGGLEHLLNNPGFDFWTQMHHVAGCKISCM